MSDTPPEAAPVVAPTKPRAPLELNVLCLFAVVIIVVADIAARAIWSVPVSELSTLSAAAITALFGIFNRSPVQ